MHYKAYDCFIQNILTNTFRPLFRVILQEYKGTTLLALWSLRNN